MARLKIKYVVEDTDRHGNVRLYFRKRGQPKIRLPGPIGGIAFSEAYERALRGAAVSQRRPARLFDARTKSGTFAWLCWKYFQSFDYSQLSVRTQYVRKITLDKICHEHGDKDIRGLEPRHVKALRDKHAATPAAANSFIKTIRQLYAFACEAGYATQNPAREIKYLALSPDGFHTWSEAEIAQFRKRHSLGSKARLALELLLGTGQRRSDVIALGRQNMEKGRLRFRQYKNSRRRPVDLSIPIMPELNKVLEMVPKDQMQFIITEFGKPFTNNGFGNKFRSWCTDAGLPHCSAHGLRKAAATRLAQHGCTPSEIAAWTGHQTLKEVSRYTRAVVQSQLADQALTKLQGANE